MTECECPERHGDMMWYGIHICRDGKRIDPHEFYVPAVPVRYISREEALQMFPEPPTPAA